MPKAIEIYVDQFTRELVVDTNHPMRKSIFRFGWDEPEKIWEAMNDTLPWFICGRVRLVQQDGSPIMSVEDRTDAAITDGLRLFASGRPIGPKFDWESSTANLAEIERQLAVESGSKG